MLLNESEVYRAHARAVPRRFFSTWFSFPFVAVLLAAALGAVRGAHAAEPGTLTVQLGNPVLSVDPLVYDDWASVFVGNHIYPRFVADPTRPWVTFVARDLRITCAEPASMEVTRDCGRIQVKFAFNEFSDCMSRKVGRGDIQFELFKTLRTKSWILPDWKACGSEEPTTICVTARNVPDVQRRLQNLYLRFGWSKAQTGDARTGAGPYCLSDRIVQSEGIKEGRLVPRETGSNLPPMRFFTSVTGETPFSVAIYGSKDLLRGRRRNVQAHTPLAYYITSHSRWADVWTPWNTSQTRAMIHAHLKKSGLLFEGDATELSRLAPAGGALRGPWKRRMEPTEPATVFLPDYMQECQALARNLARAWISYPKLVFKCVDISSYTDKFIRTGEVDFDAFVSPLSPGAPGRDAIRIQYFSSDSRDSWTKQYRDSDRIFYLIGMGESVVTVDGERFCGLEPRSMGLGDIAITDFLPCRR